MILNSNITIMCYAKIVIFSQNCVWIWKGRDRKTVFCRVRHKICQANCWTPSCMAISRSYPRHLVKFLEKKHFSITCLKKDATLKRCKFWKDSTFYLPGYLPGYSPGYLPSARLSTRRLIIHPPGYSSGYLMLPNLTNQLIKLSNGDL